VTVIENSVDYLFEKLPIGSHVALLYDDEKEKLDFLALYYKAGIDNNEWLLHLTDSIPAETFKKEMEKRGVSFKSKNNHHINDAEQIYCPNGEFSPDNMIDLLIDFAEGSFSGESYLSARCSGDMSWALKYLESSRKLFEYEAKLNHIIRNLPFIGCCAYDLKKFSCETVIDILKTHPVVVYNGNILHNPIYQDLNYSLEEYYPHKL
jgi:hypothetical protein